MGTSRAQHWRTHRKGRGVLSAKCRLHLQKLRILGQEGRQVPAHALHAVLSRIPGILGQFPSDGHRKMVFPHDPQQFLLDHRIQFLQDQHFRESFQKPNRQFLREGMGGSDLQEGNFPGKGFLHIGIGDSSCGDPLSLLLFPAFHPVKGTFGKTAGKFFIPGLDLLMVLIGKPGKDHPPSCILHKSFRRLSPAAFLHINGSAAMADPCCGPQQHRGLILLGTGKGSLHHLISLLRGRGIEYRKLGECSKVPGVLFCLGRNGTWVVRGHDHHAPFHTYIGQAHQRIAGHI